MTMTSNLLGIPIFRSKCDSAPPPPPPLPPLTAGSSGGGGGGIISTTESAIVDTTSAATSNKLPPPPPPPATATTATTNTTTSATTASSSEQLDASIAQIASSVTSVPNPGPLEASTWDVRRLTSLDTYDGMRCDISKQLSPYFAVVHSFQLGTSGLPEGKNSNYCMTSQMNDENGFMMCRVDPDRQSVDGRIHHSLLGGLAMGKLQVGTSTEGQHDQLLGELDFGGMTWTGNIKYGSMGGGNVYGFNYFQGVTPRLALGGEAMYVGVNGNKIGSYTAKYALYPDGKKEEEGGVLLLAGSSGGASAAGGGVPPGEAPSYLAATYNSGQSMLSLAYKRCITPNNRVTLATSLECSPMTLESQVFVGAEFNLTRSKMNICVDGSGRIQSVLGANLGREPGSPTLNFVAELDHGKSFMKFGYGLNIGS
jgi:mitochondrial import receptor subunit TOM40